MTRKKNETIGDDEKSDNSGSESQLSDSKLSDSQDSSSQVGYHVGLVVAAHIIM